MLAFTLRRALQAIGVMFAVGIIAFSMFRFAGDPVNQIVSHRYAGGRTREPCANRSASMIPCRCSSSAISPMPRSSSSASPTSSVSRSRRC